MTSMREYTYATNTVAYWAQGCELTRALFALWSEYSRPDVLNQVRKVEQCRRRLGLALDAGGEIVSRDESAITTARLNELAAMCYQFDEEQGERYGLQDLRV